MVAGNDNLNALTTAKKYKLRIELSDFENNTRYAEYDNFVVESAAEFYKLSSLGTYNGTAGEYWEFCSWSCHSPIDAFPLVRNVAL